MYTIKTLLQQQVNYQYGKVVKIKSIELIGVYDQKGIIYAKYLVIDKLDKIQDINIVLGGN